MQFSSHVVYQNGRERGQRSLETVELTAETVQSPLAGSLLNAVGVFHQSRDAKMGERALERVCRAAQSGAIVVGDRSVHSADQLGRFFEESLDDDRQQLAIALHGFQRAGNVERGAGCRESRRRLSRVSTWRRMRGGRAVAVARVAVDRRGHGLHRRRLPRGTKHRGKRFERGAAHGRA